MLKGCLANNTVNSALFIELARLTFGWTGKTDISNSIEIIRASLTSFGDVIESE